MRHPELHRGTQCGKVGRPLAKSKKRRLRTAPGNSRSITRMAFYGPTAVEGQLLSALFISSVWAWNQSWSAFVLVLSLDS